MFSGGLYYVNLYYVPPPHFCLRKTEKMGNKFWQTSTMWSGCLFLKKYENLEQGLACEGTAEATKKAEEQVGREKQLKRNRNR